MEYLKRLCIDALEQQGQEAQDRLAEVVKQADATLQEQLQRAKKEQEEHAAQALQKVEKAAQ